MHPGELIAGRYRLDKPVGHGGMGVVWRAIDEQLNRVVALKHARRDDRDLAKGSRQLRREAKVIQGLDHPHVVRFHGTVDDGDQSWLVMEYVESDSLATLVKERDGLPAAKVAELGAQLADALSAVHSQRVGNTLNDNLLRELLLSTTLVPPDLALLDQP